MANLSVFFASVRVNLFRQGLFFSVLYQIALTVLIFFFLFKNVPDLSLTALENRFNNWDGNSYIYLAKNGYTTLGEPANYIAFYPLYPFLIRLVMIVVPWPHLAAVLITAGASIIGHTVLYLFLTKHDPHIAKRAFLLVCLSPITVYFSLICTEGIFLLWTACFLFSMQQKKYPLAVVFGFLASLTRLLGSVFIIYYIVALLEKHAFKKLDHHVLLAPFIPLGYGVYLLMNTLLFQDPFHYQQILDNVWFKHIVTPWSQYWDTVLSTIRHFPINPPTYTVDVLLTLLFPVVILVYIAVARKKTWIAGTAWAIATWLITVSQSYWLSNARYIGLIIPFYIMIATILKPRLLFAAAAIGLAILSVWGVDLFTKGAWLY